MTAARQLGSSGSNPMGQQWEMWRVDFSFVTSQGRENSMQRLALQMFSAQYRHHTEKSLWTHIYLLESPWNPWAHTPSVTSSSVSGAVTVEPVGTHSIRHIIFCFCSKGCYVSPVLAACDTASSVRTEDEDTLSSVLWAPLFTKEDKIIPKAQEVSLPRDNENNKLSEGFGSLF